ncbi:uncharacterized protein si:ch211-106e7.2 [Toxotes jaculatrix]|uniref:uncharacterized protein si:ch211-106e7.2 n=1 Tax=Toxotes jaculatrix TaxID=941984 RepID=UPI001B3AE08F|nr:uncharacterized protein si:ch211-106e7.2 [Toxotes jaculatrix]
MDGPPSISSQAATMLTHDTMRHQQARTTKDLLQYRTVNMNVWPTQTHYTFQDGAYTNRQTSNQQTSSLPHQAVSSEQPAGRKNNSYFNFSLSNLTNMQSGNPCSPATNGYQGVAQQAFYQNSAQNSKTQTLPNMMTTYSQKNMSAHWNQPVTVHVTQSRRAQDGNDVPDPQHCVQKSLYQNVNGKLTKSWPVSFITSTSLPHEQAVCTSTLVSASAHNRQTVNNQNHRQNIIQHGFSPSMPSPSYNYSAATNSPSSGPIWNDSSRSQRSQQYSAQLNPAHDSGGEATSSMNSDSNSCRFEERRFVQKADERRLNPADARQQMLLCLVAQTIAKPADNLQKSYVAGSDGLRPVHRTSSPYMEKQFDEARMAQRNPAVQPATQFLRLVPGQSLPNTTQNVMSRTQHTVNAPPHQSSLPDVFFGTATGDRSGNGSNAGNAFFPENNSFSKGNLVGSSTDASQQMQLPKSISPQRTETQSCVVNNSEMLASVKQNDGSIYSPPGCTGTRVVAVVQPLSQESYQVASKQISSNTINQLGECTSPDKSLIFLENPNQKKSNRSAVRHSAASSDGTLVSSSDSAGPHDLPQKQLCANDRESELDTSMQVDQHVAPPAQQSVTSEVPVSQNGERNNSEKPTDPKACFFDLSSIPATPWTATALGNLILEAETGQMELKDFTKLASVDKLLSMFWDGSSKTLVYKLKTGWYKDLITDIKEFCSKYVTSDSVILSQVQQSSSEQLKSYHVLKDNEVYSELPYRSSWLNVNKQVDDIDKGFGFPWYFRHHLHTLDSGNQPDQVGTVNSIHSPVVSEVPNKVSSQTELEPGDSGEEKQASTAETIPTQPSSPVETDSSDPYYSFKIQVLPPEEAKVIFEQVQSQTQQSMDTDSQPEKVVRSSVEDELPDVRDVTLRDAEQENSVIPPVDQVCCFSRWLEKIVRPDSPSLTECECKKEQNHKVWTDKTLDKEATTVQKNDNLCVIGFDRKFHSAKQGESQAKTGGNINKQIMTCSWPDQCNDLSQTIDLDDEKPGSHSDNRAKSISQISINDSQSSIIIISDEGDEELSGSESEIPNQIPHFVSPMSEPEEDRVRDQLKSAGSSQSSSSDNSKEKIKNVLSSECASHMSNPEADRAQAKLTSTDLAESSLETEEEQTQVCATAALQTTFSLSDKLENLKRKTKAQSSHEQMSPFLKKLKKCRPSLCLDSEPVLKGVKHKKVFVDSTNSEPSASNDRLVELVLFGSARQRKCVLNDNAKSRVSSPEGSSGAVQRPPEILSVNLNSLTRKSSVPTGEYSVKRWIHEKWRGSYLPIKTKHRRKLKKQKRTFADFSGVSLNKVETAGSTNTEELPVSSEMRICNTKRRLSLKRRSAVSNRLKLGEEDMREDVATRKWPGQERRNAENGSHAVVPLEENSGLRFSVLPDTFSFADGSNSRKGDAAADNSDLVEGKDRSLSKTTTTAKDTWCPRSEKRFCPLRSPPVPNTSSLFQEFQKKYMEKRRPSMDKSDRF